MAFSLRYSSVSGSGAHNGLTEADAWSAAEAVTNHAAGMHIYFKDTGTYGSMTFANSGTDTQWIWFEGYTTTPGDGGRVTANNFVSFQGNNHIVQGFEATKINGIALDVRGNHGILIDCSGECVSPLATSHSGIFLKVGSSAISCQAKTHGTIGTGIYVEGTPGGAAVGCSVSSSDGTSGIRDLAAYGVIAIGCVFEGNGTSGYGVDRISVSTVIAIGNTFSGFNTGIRPKLNGTTGTELQLAVNNLIDNCTNGIVAADANKTGMTVSHNCLGRITSNRYDLGDTPIAGDQTHTKDPFVDSANDNYYLNSVRGGGDIPRQDGLEAERG